MDSNIERDELAHHLEMEFGTFLAHSPHKPDLFWGRAAGSLLRIGYTKTVAETKTESLKLTNYEEVFSKASSESALGLGQANFSAGVAAVVLAAKIEAWDEGYDECAGEAFGGNLLGNPYRKETE